MSDSRAGLPFPGILVLQASGPMGDASLGTNRGSSSVQLQRGVTARI